LYQALYRKWRPRVFDDVVGQEHITDTLRRQVESGRLSHAYLFTGTRGTGKTTCAKLLARAVNCEHPVNGSPCNCCPSCLGIENGSILDVLELDAASNNRVDDVRAILDEASYSPATVKKRVYIVDEVHMLSTQAFNALLQILEEPPEHLMFILATTEIHKVPATIKSRCQQFSFKRIHADAISARLRHVAQAEGLPLTAEGAALVSRLADGGMRDALSLLDQCIGNNEIIGESEILSALGLAGNVDTARLMSSIADGDTESALSQLDHLYAGGKEMAALLGELASLTRDLLIRKTAPTTGASLMTGGFDANVLKTLGTAFTTARLVHMLTVLQRAASDIIHSTNRRIDAELCLIMLCDPTADSSPNSLIARLNLLEQRIEQGIPLHATSTPASHVSVSVASSKAPSVSPVSPSSHDDPPPWSVESEGHPVNTPSPRKSAVLEPVPEPAHAPKATTVATSPKVSAPAGTETWNTLCARLSHTLNVADFSFVGNPDTVTGSVSGSTVTLWVSADPLRFLIDTPSIRSTVSETAANLWGRPFQTVVKVGKAPPETSASTVAPAASQQESPAEFDALEAFLSENQGLGNITVSD